MGGMAAVLNFIATQSGALTAALLALVILIGLIVLVVKSVRPLRWLVNGLGDLFGQPARPGVERVPGIVERQASTDKRLDDMQTGMASITATLAQHGELLLELAPNHGGSLKDITVATHLRVADLAGKIEQANTPPTTINVNTTTNEGQNQ